MDAARPVGPASPRGPASGPVGDLVAGLGALAAVTGPTWALLDLPASYPGAALAAYGVLAALVLARLPAGLPGAGLGAANRVTLLRAVLVLSVAALVAVPGDLGPSALWWAVGVSTLALVLDGVDGWVARRTGTRTAFGARFDMELDAFLMLVLSALVWEAGRAGSWVLLIGLMRYLFVGAARLWPVLRAPLPPSFRRKAVCVVQGAVLLVALGPPIPAGVAVPALVGGLASLAWSFGVDVAWLARNGRGPEPAGA